MSYRPVQIANEIIARFGAAGDISPMKLQKLLYFANGWYLALRGEDLINERPQVWRYGPVFKSAYRTFNKYGSSPITSPEPASPFGGAPDMVENIDQQLEQYLNWVWSEYGHKSGPALSDETHRVGTPWQQIAQSSGYVVPENTVIPAQADHEYFSSLARQRGYQPAALTQA
ncbi:type II toxin-antitoxin system antitoxin SocA domain-containing protein [uncultured Agrobacterium sp.]|uniref:Panacea domain-containing protein n=1 Tax=uncultured Agrobacterium sp. TaxID=157277 RepID=UPI0025D73F80|nr:type II toxin-antitoxin system antitoxin SocA domain-containing protein [uncultured Agrobacterium sp.]